MQLEITNKTPSTLPIRSLIVKLGPHGHLVKDITAREFEDIKPTLDALTLADQITWSVTRSSGLAHVPPSTTVGGAAVMSTGTGSPNTVVTGSVGDIYLRTDGGAGTTLYIKESGAATNTGWIDKP